MRYLSNMLPPTSATSTTIGVAINAVRRATWRLKVRSHSRVAAAKGKINLIGPNNKKKIVKIKEVLSIA